MRRNLVVVIVLGVIAVGGLSIDAQDTAAMSSRTGVAPQASAFFFWPKEWPKPLLKPIIFSDDAELATIENATYFEVRLSPGKHTFRTQHMKDGITVDLDASKTYYFVVKHGPGLPVGHSRLELIDPELGERVSKDPAKVRLKPLNPAKVVDKSQVVAPTKRT